MEKYAWPNLTSSSIWENTAHEAQPSAQASLIADDSPHCRIEWFEECEIIPAHDDNKQNSDSL